MIRLNNDPPACIQRYMDTCKVRLSQIESTVDASHNGNMDIRSIFVPLSTNIELDAYIENRKILAIMEGEQKPGRRIPEKYASFIDRFNERIINDQTNTPLIFKPKWKNGFIRHFCNLNAIEAITANKYCVVTSPAGGGKSLLLQFIALKLMENFESHNVDLKNYTLSNLLLDESFFPLYVPIRNLANRIKNGEKNNSLDKAFFLTFLFGQDVHECEDEVVQFLRNQNIIFLYDGVDEIIHAENRDYIVNKLIRISESFADEMRIVFSARDEIGYKWIPKKFKQFELMGMTVESREQLSINTLKEYGYSDDDALSITETFLNDIDLKQLDDELISSPLFFSLLINIYIERDSLPSYKSLLLNESISLLIRRWRQKLLENEYLKHTTNDFVYDDQNFRYILEETAYDSLIGNYILTQESLDFPEVIINDIIMKMLSREYGGKLTNTDINLLNLKDQILSCLIDNIGIIKESTLYLNRKEFRFSHRIFQVYLASKKISDPRVYRDTIDNLLFNKPWNYEHVLVMLVEIMHDNGNILDLLGLLIKILSFLNTTSLIRYDEVHSWLTWFMTIIVSSRDYALLSNASSFKYYRFEDLLLGINKCILKALESTYCRLSNRVYCARYLSDLPRVIKAKGLQDDFNYKLELFGDRRHGVGLLTNRVPDIDWCHVDGGSFTMGLSKRIERNLQKLYPNHSFEREIPPRMLSVDSFEMSRFPITFSQYRAFCEAGAYEDESLWKWSNVSQEWFDDVGRRKSLSSLFNNTDNSPVVNICWIEAKGFCEWLSSITSQNIRLPYEHEWEYASKKLYDIYSITDEFDEDIYISEKLRLQVPAPVGIYPYPQRIPSDLNGNVWEWTQTRINKDESLSHFSSDLFLLNRSDYNSLSAQTRMVLRGGCYLNSPFMSRNTYRGRDYIYHISNRQSFRIVLEK